MKGKVDPQDRHKLYGMRSFNQDPPMKRNGDRERNKRINSNLLSIGLKQENGLFILTIENQYEFIDYDITDWIYSIKEHMLEEIENEINGQDEI